MKKRFIIFMAVLLVVAATITVVSCKKDKTEEKVSSISILTENNHADNMDEFLIGFKQKMLSAQKGDETLGLEQARQNLINLLNFDFGDANNPTDMFVCDTIDVKIPLTNRMVDLSQLATIYNATFDQILAAYRTLDLSEKSVYSIISEYPDPVNKDDNYEDLRIIVNYRGFSSFPLSGHDTLSWHPRRIDYSCDDPSIFGGGAFIMQNWLMDSQEGLACSNGGRLYFTDEHDWNKNGYVTYDETEGRFKIFSVFTYRIDTVCISHEDMEYYYSNILNYYNQETSGVLSSRGIMSTYVDTGTIPYSQPNLNGYPGDLWYWRIFIHYGKPNCSGSSPMQ